MPLACPHCHEPIETTDPPPVSCGHCGGLLPRAAASDITLDYAPQRAGHDSETLGSSKTAAPPGRGRRIGEYRLLRPLGEGGMGVVWEAEQAETGRRVALKLISPSLQPTRETVDRFLREGRLAAAVSHPRSTFVFGAGEEDGQPYIAMELMPGDTLKDILDREGPLPLERAVDCILDVIDGLEAAHAQGVIHRDVKPSNCFLDSEGRVKVGDFGLSKSLVSEAELTRTGAFMGTPQFAAPEQVRGGGVTPATDVYAVGATLFCLLTGRGPFVGDAVAVIAQITSEPPPPLRSLGPAVPRAVERIVARTLQKDPSRRFADLAQLRQALAPFATGGSSIADVGRRLAAYMIDEIAVSLVMIIAIVFMVAIAFWIPRLLAVRSMESILQIARTGLGVVYFAISEARWGCGLGKLILGLRVLGPKGEPPDYARSLLRALFVPGALGLTLVTPMLDYLSPSEAATASARFNLAAWAAGFLPRGFALLCMVTMRARNGFRGFHELISGTRVIRPRRAATARRRRLPVVAATAIEHPANCGPFRVVGELGSSGLCTVRWAQDSLLGRPVWIYESPAGRGAFSAARRAVARPAKLRWLQAGLSAGGHWDAFEAVVGAPLAQALRCGAPWDQARSWLLDLAEELEAAAADETLPASLSLDQVWITHGGRVKLLDAVLRRSPKQGSPRESPFEPRSANESPSDIPFAAPMPAEAGALVLLRNAMNQCTGGQLLPSHVRAFAKELAARPATRETLHWAVSQLREVTCRPTALGWDDRLGVFAVTMGTELSLYFAAAFSMVWFVVETLRWPHAAVAATGVAGWLLPAIVGFVCRGGPAFWLTRIEVLGPDGRRAGRWRCAWRNLVAWTPMTLPYAIMASVYPLMSDSDRATRGLAHGDLLNLPALIFSSGLCLAGYLGVNLCFGVVYALFRPQRGLQDWLARTYLMPR